MQMIKFLSLFLPLFMVSLAIAEEDPKPTAKLSKAEQAFEAKINGVALVGQFTVDEAENQNPKKERYEIYKVTKLDGNNWLFITGIKYGNTNTRVPITLPVYFSDDNTPVITLDNLTIPGMGTFSGRVLFHGERYVGTWQHGKVGGHMFGKLEKLTYDKAK